MTQHIRSQQYSVPYVKLAVDSILQSYTAVGYVDAEVKYPLLKNPKLSELLYTICVRIRYLNTWSVFLFIDVHGTNTVLATYHLKHIPVLVMSVRTSVPYLLTPTCKCVNDLNTIFIPRVVSLTSLPSYTSGAIQIFCYYPILSCTKPYYIFFFFFFFFFSFLFFFFFFFTGSDTAGDSDRRKTSKSYRTHARVHETSLPGCRPRVHHGATIAFSPELEPNRQSCYRECSRPG